jgi:hypothetical protein
MDPPVSAPGEFGPTLPAPVGRDVPAATVAVAPVGEPVLPAAPAGGEPPAIRPARAGFTAAQRAVAAALLFLAAAALAGVAPTDTGIQYRTFGIVEGVFSLLLTYVLLQRRAWTSPAGIPAWAAVVYGTVASAQIAEFLFPPPGVVEWVVVATLALSGWGALSRGPRRRIVFGLATLALLMALLRYSVIPVMWGVGPQPGGDLLGVGDLAQGARRVIADHQPVHASAQLFGFAAMACWALATRLIWPVLPRRPARRKRTAAAVPESS